MFERRTILLYLLATLSALALWVNLNQTPEVNGSAIIQQSTETQTPGPCSMFGTATPSPAPTDALTPSATPSPCLTVTRTPFETLTQTPGPCSMFGTPTPSATPTDSLTPTATPSPCLTVTITPFATSTQTPGPCSMFGTPTPSATPTDSLTPTATPSPCLTVTMTPFETFAPSHTPSPCSIPVSPIPFVTPADPLTPIVTLPPCPTGTATATPIAIDTPNIESIELYLPNILNPQDESSNQCAERLVPPILNAVEPLIVFPGSEIIVSGTGGYITDDCGFYNESARSFDLFLDGEPTVDLLCYVNYCQTDITLAENIEIGPHCLSLSPGGCTLAFDVASP